MKKIIFCITLLMVANSIYSQQSNPSPTLTKKDYLQKSKNQKTTAWLFLAGGMGITALGISSDNEDNNKSENTGEAVALVAGIASICTSITFFILATENKKKAESLSFKMEKAPQLQQGSLVNRYYPALSFRVKL